MRQDLWTPTKASCICSQHFLPTDYTDAQFSQHLSKTSRKVLKRDAITSLFEFTGHLQKKPSNERNECLLIKKKQLKLENKTKPPN